MNPDNEHSSEAIDENDDEVPRLGHRFGHAGDFWKRYDEVADTKDREMSRDLNSNVDVLLIFAGLFSAVNTAFISFTMPSLSADSSAETNFLLRLLVLQTNNNTLTDADLSSAFTASTNSVLVNCLLYSSLCCSLLAAMWAMVGKEWLQNIDRTGQVGPLEYQAKFRQLNKPVASVVIAFVCLAILLLCSTIVAGAISPGCPYQTALSRALGIAIASTRNGVHRWREKFRRAHTGASDSEARSVGSTTQMSLARTQSHRSGFTGLSAAGPPLDATHALAGNSTPAYQSSHSVNGQHSESRDEFPSRGPSSASSLPVSVFNRLKENLRHRFASAEPKAHGAKGMHARRNEDHILNAQAACWLFDMTSDLQDRLTVAQNICNLNTEGCEAVLAFSDMWQHLLSLTFEALQSWRDQPTRETRRIVELFGAALGYLLLERSLDDVMWKLVKRRFRGHLFTCQKIRLSYLEYVLTGKLHTSSSNEDTESALKLVFLRTGLHRNRTSIWTTFVCPTSGPWDDRVLNVLACMVAQEFLHDSGSQVFGHSPSPPSGSISQPTYSRKKLFWGESFGPDLQRNLEWGLRVFSSPMFLYQSAILDIGSAFMRRMRDFVYEDKLDNALKESLIESLPLLTFKILNEPSSEDPNIVAFLMEWIELVKSLYLWSSPAHRSERVLGALWIALEYLIDAADGSQGTPTLEQGFVLSMFKFLLLNLKSGPLKGLEKHPRLIAYIGPQLATVAGLQDLWIKNGLSVLVLAWLRASQTKDELLNSTRILDSVATSTSHSQQFVKDGFVDALIEVTLLIESRRDLFDENWGDWQLFVLKRLLSTWKQVNGRLGTDWPSNRLLSAINRPLRRLAERIEQEPGDGTNSGFPTWDTTSTPSVQRSDLLLFVDNVKELRAESALIARDFDVVINRIRAQLDRTPSWGYDMYANFSPAAVCSVPEYKDNYLL